MINTRTYFFNVEDLNNPFLEYTYVGNNAAIDHNLYIKDGIAYQSNYRAGLRMLDVNNPTNPRRSGLHRHLPVKQLRGLQRHMVQLPLLRFRRGGGEPH